MIDTYIQIGHATLATRRCFARSSLNPSRISQIAKTGTLMASRTWEASNTRYAVLARPSALKEVFSKFREILCDT